MDPTPFLDALQWPAMAVSVLAAWFTGSQQKRRRQVGFRAFLLSNVLWIAWGWHDGAWALVVLQFALAAMNLQGGEEERAGDGLEKADAAATRGIGRREQLAYRADEFYDGPRNGARWYAPRTSSAANSVAVEVKAAIASAQS